MYHRLSPNWKEWTFYNGMTVANIKTWNRVRNYLIYTKKANRIPDILSCGEDPIILYTLANSKQNEEESQCKDCTSLTYSIIAKQAKHNLDFILANLKKYK